ncbi:hypothetical protein [Stenotrophomonas maltophilia]|uniref:hypothetical protein n=1 Tax=Stenotrophomonas maltophilia TaxID=40324 RepID=UPI001F5385CA|nr:hypothetical protein [Stenotrophomonas maltophilia]MCI1151927.1 hypothetical protein [Stenotrophomonas maltophilia]
MRNGIAAEARRRETAHLACTYNDLIQADPRSLRNGESPTTCSIAAAFYQKKINCEDPLRTAPAAAYFGAESAKRVSAFVFENLFSNRIAKNHEISTGWHACRTPGKTNILHWFKLLHFEGQWNSLDQEFSKSLIAQGHSVWRAWFRHDSLFISGIKEKSTVYNAVEFIEKNPFNINSSSGRVREMSDGGELPMKALEHLLNLDRNVLNRIIQSRIFMNCFLELVTWRPFDVDAVCKSGKEMFVAEFKRKYPSKEEKLGIDQHLIFLADALSGICPLHHFILLDSAGRSGKGSDPTSRILGPYNEGPNFSWLGLSLEPNLQQNYRESLYTTGNDSGQRKGNRKQLAIPLAKFTRLVNGTQLIDSETI